MRPQRHPPSWSRPCGRCHLTGQRGLCRRAKSVLAGHSRPLEVPGTLRGSIVGGREVAPHSRPYMASLQLDEKHICGAVLVRPRRVLTAAHCEVAWNLSDFRVVLGAHNLNTPEPTQQVFNITRAVPYPLYNAQQDIHDIQLLKLHTSACRFLRSPHAPAWPEPRFTPRVTVPRDGLGRDHGPRRPLGHAAGGHCGRPAPGHLQRVLERGPHAGHALRLHGHQGAPRATRAAPSSAAASCRAWCPSPPWCAGAPTSRTSTPACPPTCPGSGTCCSTTDGQAGSPPQ
ncbi:complement factor D isoform X5 [Equus caballus]|uniref:complement factor D isoform X5 n=1 Tax=Equus caballus TaxID=9796 RepID=UPI0038B29F94